MRQGTVGHTACSLFIYMWNEHISWKIYTPLAPLPLPSPHPIDGTCSTTCVCCQTHLLLLLVLLLLLLLLPVLCCFEIAVALAGCQLRVLSVDTVPLLLLPPFPFLSIFCCAVRGDNCRSAAAAAAAYVALSLAHTLVSLSSLLCTCFPHIFTHTHTHTRAQSCLDSIQKYKSYFFFRS